MPILSRFLRTATLLIATSAGVAACGGASEWNEGDGYRWRPLTVPESSKVGFTRLDPAETGVTFVNTISAEAAVAQRALFNGSGLAAGDVNGDGLPDLYFASSSTPNQLYINEGGLRFREALEAGGASAPDLVSAGAVLVDTDGDRDLDLVLTAVGDLRLYTNDGKGRFTDVGATLGITSTSGNTSVALADIDGDGDLDLYVAAARKETMRDVGAVTLQRVGTELRIPPDLQDRLAIENGTLVEYGEADQLFINDGSGRFDLASWTDGRFLDEHGSPLAKPPFDWGLAVGFYDVNGDGAPDLYVCNDFATPDRFWINDGTGRFHAVGNQAVRTISATSMGVDFADINRDGHVDLFIDDMLSPDLQRRQRQMQALGPELEAVGVLDYRSQVPRNTLLVSRGDGTYAEAANLSGVDASDWSWATAFLDVDLDGFEDLLVVNGHPFDMQDADATAKQRRVEGTEAQRRAVLEYPILRVPNVAFRNRGDLTFEDVSDAWGFGEVGISHGLAMADLDGDGDLDVVTNNLDEPAGVYRNEGSAPRVAVQLQGQAPNTYGVGASITLTGGAVPVQSQQMISGGLYLSGSEQMRTFAASDGPMSLEVTWRSGAVSLIPVVTANTLIVVIEPDPALPNESPTAAAAPPEPLFEDVSVRIGYAHHEDGFNDFAMQRLIPRRLSILGPGVAWADIDGNGTDDLVVGAGRRGRLVTYLGDGKGGFTSAFDPANAEMASDVTGLAAWNGYGASGVLAATSNLESTAGAAVQETVPESLGGTKLIRSEDGAIATVELVAPGLASSGPLAVADVDGDGDLDLFVGGRVLAQRYPEAAPSRLFRTGQNGLEADTAADALFAEIGLVSGAVWTDLTGDGLPELVLAREWDSPAIFANDGGVLSLATSKWGIERLTGWWNGVAAGDLNGDGAIDLVLTNWGRNTEYRASAQHPLAILHGDLDGDGAVDIVETLRDPADGSERPLRRIDDLGRWLPFVAERVSSVAQYAESSVDDLFSDHLANMRRVEVTTLDSMVLLNRGSTFEARPLPVEAQFAPAFGVSLADFDGDGHLDLFIAQNYSGQQPRMAAANAGRGLLMTGHGDGTFAPVPGAESGIATYADGRGSAVADFDGDGRPDLAIGQNATAMLLLRNKSGVPGLRVRLAGPPGNPTAVGAALRGGNANYGPVIEVHAGNGYWSSDSPVRVLPGPPPERIWVRWPGGVESEHDVPAGAVEVLVSPDAIEVLVP